MTHLASTSPSTIVVVAAASLAFAAGLTACVRTVGGPLPQAGQGQALTTSAGAGGDGYGGPAYGGDGYGGLAYGGGSHGGDSYGGLAYGGDSYGGDSYGGLAYGGGSYGGRPPIVDIYACRADADCTVYFRTHGCFPGDPIGVATATLDVARRLLPERFEACGMGGPDYERRRLELVGRYVARCDQARCAITDRGPQRAPF